MSLVGFVVFAVILTFGSGLPEARAASPAFVQSANSMVYGGKTLTVTLTSPVSAGSVLALAVGWSGRPFSVSSITDNKGNVWSAPLNPVDDGHTGGGAQAYAKNAAAGSTTITVTLSGAPGFSQILVHEIKNVNTVSPLDVSAGKAQFLPGTATNAVTSGLVTPASDSDYLFGAVFETNNGGGVKAGSAPWVARVTSGIGRSEDQVQSVHAAIAATFTNTNTFSCDQTFIMAFKPSGPDTTPPTVSLTAPVSGALIATSTTVSATAADNVGVAGVQFLLDGANLGAEVTTSPYSFAWNTAGVASGAHSLAARARDAAGNMATSTGASVTVDNQAPTGGIIIDGGAALTNSTAGVLTLSASDNLGTVSQMRFSNTGSGFSAPVAYAASANWTLSAGDGQKIVYVQFADPVGNWSGSFSGTIVLDTTAPVISAVAASGTNATSTTITWTTNEPASSQVEYGTGLAYGQLTAIDNTLVTTHSVTLSGMSSNTVYDYRVRSKDAATNEAIGGNNVVTTLAILDLTPPSVPANLAGNAVSDSQINLSWTASTDNVGVAGYQVFRNGSQVATTTSAVYADLNLSPNTTYSYAVAAFDVSGNNSGQSGAVGAATLADTTLPTATITNPANNAVLSGTVAATATAGDDIGVVKLEFYVDNVLAVTDLVSPYSFSWDTTGVPDGSHTLVAKAYDAAGNVGISGNVIVTVSNTDTTTPSTPAGLTATAISTSAINLSWTASTDNVGVTGYKIFRGGSQIGTSAVNSYSDTGLTASTQYSYTVSAYDAAGNNSAQSTAAIATTQGDTQAPSVPTNLTATPVSSSVVTLSWTASTDNIGVTGYKVFRGGSQIGTSATNSYTDTGLAASTQYAYTVSAYDATGNNSSQSSSVSATTQAPASCTDAGIVDFSGGTSGQAVSNSALNASGHGFTGNWNWVTHIAGGMTFQSAAHGPLNWTKPFCSGGNYSDNSSLGLSYDTSSGGVQYVMFNYPSNQGTLHRSVAGVWFSTNLPQNSGVNIDLGPTHQAGSGLGFNNIILYSDGVQLEFRCETSPGPSCTMYDASGNVSNFIPVVSSLAQRYWITDSYSDDGSLYRGQVYAEDPAHPGSVGALLGSWTGGPNGSGNPPGYTYLGDGINFALPAGYVWRYDHFTTCWTTNTTTCPFPLLPDTGAPDTTAPAVPANLTATAISSSAINLSWQAATDPDNLSSQISYVVFRNNSQIATTTGGSTSYSDTGLAPSTAYSYTVVAQDPAGNFSPQSAPAGAITQDPPLDNTPPSVPVNLTATAVSSAQINLSWVASTDNVAVAGYNIFRAGVPIGTSAANSYSDTGLTASTTYSYTVSAFDAAGNVSAQSAPAAATTQSAGGSSLPVAFDALAPSSSGLSCASCTTLSWNHTVTSTANSLLTVSVAVGSQNDGPLSLTATYNGVAMTSAAKVHADGQSAGFTQLFYLKAPDAGSHTVRITLSGGSADLEAGSVSFANVSQTTPLKNITTNFGSGTSASVVVPSAAGDMVVDSAANGSAINASGQTLQWKNNQNTHTGGGDGAQSVATGSVAVTMSYGVANDWWGIIGADVVAAP